MITIRLADVNIGIQNLTEFSPLVEGWLTDGEPDFTVRVEPRELRLEDRHRALATKYLEFICAYRHIAEELPLWDAFVCHGAVVAMDGRAYLFTAPSGTGKTTHAELWLRRFEGRAWILNGDKPILRRTPGGFTVCGTPWRGKENYGVNAELPLRGICLLSRGEENAIRPGSASDLLRFLSKQIYFPKQEDRAEKLLELLDALCTSVPFWTMRCNMELSAPETAWEAMRPRA